ncbi:MAG: glycoside hydrolase family 11 protein [Oscillospiraceae bacterium]|nr:glycoside hydrolase family 11 protein [Oscillospiraceae bacterium]
MLKMRGRIRISRLLIAVLFIFVSIFAVSAESTYPVVKRNKIDRYGEFDFEFWVQNSGEATMTLTGGGTFECEWTTQTHNALFRMGKKLGSTKPHDEYGEISIEYDASYYLTSGNVSYLCVYGWTKDPLIEFYVVENYGSYRPPGGSGFKGRTVIDGATYDIYETTRNQQPSIEGTKTFQQYFSVRATDEKSSSGTISISEHFRAWEELGMDMSGVMYEVALCIEGFQSAGQAVIRKNILTIGDDVYGADFVLSAETEPEPPEEEEPDKKEEEIEEPATETEVSTTPPNEVEPNEDGVFDSRFLLFGGIALGAVALGVGVAVVVKKHKN